MPSKLPTLSDSFDVLQSKVLHLSMWRIKGGGGGGGFWTDRGHFTFLKKVWSLFSISTQGDEKLLKSDQDPSPLANYIPCSCCIFSMNNWLTILSCKNIHREVILITLLFLLSIKEHFNLFNTGNYFTC